MQEKLPSEDIPYILEVEEVIMPLIEYKEASIFKIMITSFEENVLKLLNVQYYWFLGMDRGGHHHSYRSSMSLAGL